MANLPLHRMKLKTLCEQARYHKENDNAFNRATITAIGRGDRQVPIVFSSGLARIKKPEKRSSEFSAFATPLAAASRQTQSSS
jgi:hypothetical protein